MDALVLGLPVVATDVGGIREAVDRGVEGILVESGDRSALADAYVELASRPEERRVMGRAAAARGGRYDVRLTQWRLEETYRRLVARTRS
jgi:glycosyltransferase involved in cell wall biosynthesis